MLSDNVVDQITQIKTRYNDVRFCLLPILHLFHKEYGWLSPRALEEVSNVLGIPRAAVKSVSTFYALFNHRQMGRHVIYLCTNVACMIMGGERFLDFLKEKYSLDPWGTTADNRFSLVIMECIGACDQAPAMLVDTDLHGSLTEERIIEILERYE